MSEQLLIRGGTVVTESVRFRADVAITDERIVALLSPGMGHADDEIDATGKYILPGVIDPHVHYGLGNGGRDWLTESQASALGGVTTVFSFLMGGESYLPEIDDTIRLAEASSHIDFGLHVVPATETHLTEMDEYVARGITSYKYFTSFRGDEGSYLHVPGTDDGFLYRYFERVSGYPGGLACVHAENIEVVWTLRDRLRKAGRDDLAAWDESRPAAVEAEAAHRAMTYAYETSARLYLVHISSRLAVDEIRAWRLRHPHAQVIVETCPHFLTHHRDMPLGPLGKINPPLRSEDDVDALWAAVQDGTIDVIGSDHVARRRAKKAGSIWTASAGFPGSGAILPILLSEGVHKRGLSLERVVSLTAAEPARALGVYPRKGCLQVGADADIAIVDLSREREGSVDKFGSYADYSLYEGWRLKGWPIRTLVRGRTVMQDGVVAAAAGHGKYISRTSH